MPIQKLTISSGLNTDSSPELLKVGESPYRLNVRVMSSENGDEQAAETMGGNTLVSFTLPSGTNKVIGAKEYLIGKKIYYFVYNSSGNHSILEYDEVANTIAKVLQNSLLGFLTQYLITGINIIQLDVTNHLLYWTDNNKQPRKINIEKGKYHTAGNYTLGYPTPFVEEFINRIKRPMPLAPVTNYTDVATVKINKVDKILFQFKVQNVFDDKEFSSWSPISKTVFPQSYLIDGANNAIIVTIDTGSEIVKRLRIAVKTVTDTAFKLVVDLDKEELGIASNGTYAFIFYNDGNYTPLEINESIKLFDNVPKKSQAQELIYGNRIADGLVTEGFDAVNVDLKLGYTLALATNPAVTATSTVLPVNALKRGGKYVEGVIYYNDANQSGATNINEGDYNVIQPNGKYGTELFIPFYTEGTSSVIYITYSALIGLPFSIGDSVTDMAFGGTGTVLAVESVLHSFTTINTLTIQSSGTWTAGGTIANLTVVGQATMDTISYTSAGSYPIVNWTLFNDPPSWATHFQLARQKNSSNGRYIQFLANNIVYLDKNGSSAPYAYNNAAVTQFKIVISPIMSDFVNENPGSLLHYDWVKGDRIRFIKSAWKNFYPAYYDFEIALYEATSMEVRVRYPVGYTPVDFNQLGGDWFEIYSPLLTVDAESQFTYEIGAGGTVTFDSARGHYIHSGTTNNQLTCDFNSATYATPPTMILALNTGHGLVAGNEVKIASSTGSYSVYGTVASVTATSATVTTSTTLVGTFNGAGGSVSKGAKGTLSGGDTFYRPRTMQFAGNTSSYTYIIEDYSYSDLFVGNGYDYGRPNRIDPDYKEIVRQSTVLWSEQFIPETNINGLSTVYDTSFQTYEDKYGGIYKFYAEDQVLMIFQELKIGAALVQQIIIDSGNGNSLIGASENILSTKINYYTGEFGIGKHPESFAVYGNAKYGIDVLRGVVWRLSNNGLTPISDTGNISTFMRDQCDSIMGSSSKVNIYGVYDTRFEEYVIAFAGFGGRLKEEPPVTLAWNEEKNAWSTFYSYAPEMMVSKGIDIITFKSGALYTHNTNVLQANFYGVQYKPSVWLYANAFPSNIKVFKAISLESDTAWNVTIITPSGQTTSMVSNNFKLKEGLVYSEVLRDDNTVNVLNPRFNGSPMRGQWALVKLEYQGTDFNKLFAVNILMIPSNRSNK